MLDLQIWVYEHFFMREPLLLLQFDFKKKADDLIFCVGFFCSPSVISQT